MASLMSKTRAFQAAVARRSRPSLVVRASGSQKPSEPSKPVERVFTDKQWDDTFKNAGAQLEAQKTGAPAPVTAGASAGKAVSVGDAFAFSGPLPETANGRLAMLGFAAALGAELATGQTVGAQFSEATVPVLITFLAFTLASLAPITKGANLAEAFGPFTPKAELVNGRAAMIGLASLLVVEAVKGSALF